MKNKKLVDFIRDYGVKASDCTDKIAVVEKYSKEGKNNKEVKYIPPTFEEVTKFLGY